MYYAIVFPIGGKFFTKVTTDVTELSQYMDRDMYRYAAIFDSFELLKQWCESYRISTGVEILDDNFWANAIEDNL